ncbi:hypothetical protein GOBAR_DD29738 [Gossypium barbadense]|nr:hypothetical protein GOBAR_DD29738 [Gossypium barbadense]
MSLQHFSHQHPLVFIESRGHEIEKVNCSGCGELVSGSSFACVECGFYLDKQCAEAPVEMDHPFHRNHNLNLLARNPYKTGAGTCDFCRKPCENFVYHCSCNLDFHIKCALFSHSIAEKRDAEFQDIARIDPSIITGNVTEELKKVQCFACWKPLLDSVYFSPNCGFYLHAKCVDLPAEINHLFHQEHPLFLQFNSQRLSCKICQKPQRPGFVYCCSLCKFALHIHCAAIPTKINQPFHRKHPLILQSVDECLPCQICQETTNLNDVVYFCSICKFVLHIRVSTCLRCSLVSDMPKCERHEHRLRRFLSKNKELCRGGAQHSFDVHDFKLTYHEGDDNYSEAHPECVLKEYPLIKPGTIYKEEVHPHHLTFFKRVEFYPDCDKCGKHCLDLSL